MTGFSADWLSLRAPADDAARDRGLITALSDWAAGRELSITDLGGGSGAGLRALSPLLPDGQRWRILDDDAALLALIPVSPSVVTAQTDLAAAPEQAIEDAPDLITGFAFFDLVSAAWIDRLVPLIARTGAAVYAPLTYDGQEIWSPNPAHEAKALAAFRADMQRDKGFGPALGAEAAPYLAGALSKAGYTVHTASSPWQLNRAHEANLIDALAQGGAGAVTRVLDEDEIAEWAAGRAAAETVLIGHQDILALPPA